MLVPVILGMWVRHKWNHFILAKQKYFRRITSLLLVAVIIYSLTAKSEVSLMEFIQAFPYAALFMSLCALLGFSSQSRFSFESERYQNPNGGVCFSERGNTDNDYYGLYCSSYTGWYFVGAVGILQMLIAFLVVVFVNGAQTLGRLSPECSANNRR